MCFQSIDTYNMLGNKTGVDLQEENNKYVIAGGSFPARRDTQSGLWLCFQQYNVTGKGVSYFYCDLKHIPSSLTQGAHMSQP